jgi:hypothetical protein
LSLIICRKEKDTLLVVSDTKLTYPDDNYPNKQTGHPSDGVIKTIIINSNLCVSFAGDIEPAEEGIEQIRPNDDLPKILKLLRNKSIGNKTDFIVCSSTPEVKIYEIKDSNCSEVQSSWIGSQNAFNRFQGYLHNQIQGGQSSFFNIEPSLTKEASELGKISGAFDKVIDDPSAPEVDGFKVRVVFQEGKFKYQGYLNSYLGQMEMKFDQSMIGQKIYIGHGTSREGSYTVNFFNSNSNFNHVGLHILQGNLGIVYSRTDNGLLRPKIFQMDEVDFVDFAKREFDIRPTGTTQDRETKYYQQAREFTKTNDFENAIKYYDKVLSVEKGKMKAIAHYEKGISLLNLRRLQDGVIEIQKAINIEPLLQKEAMKLLTKLKRN